MKWNEINLNALNEMAPYLPPKTVRCCPYSPKPGVALFFQGFTTCIDREFTDKLLLEILGYCSQLF